MKHIHLLLLALLALFAGSPFRATAEESFRDRVVVIPVGEDSLTSKQSFGLGNQRDDDEKHPAADHPHLRLRESQGHVRRGAHLRGMRQDLHGARLLHRRGGHHHLLRGGDGPRHAQEGGKRLLGLHPLRGNGKGLPPGSSEGHDDPLRPGAAIRPRQAGKRRTPDPDGQGGRHAAGRRQAPAGPGNGHLRHGPAGPGEGGRPHGHGGTHRL